MPFGTFGSSASTRYQARLLCDTTDPDGRRRGSIRPAYSRLAARRGNRIAHVAAARKLVCLVYCDLRDRELRCLTKAGVARPEQTRREL